MPFDKEKELRRERSTLRSLALGIVAFGLWSVLKTIISLMMVRHLLQLQIQACALRFMPSWSSQRWQSCPST